MLLIHLKRFSVKGHFTEKIENFVDFPLKNLDLTNYMPSPLPPGVGGTHPVSADDPRAQVPPYRYDLYGVTNHFGTLSSGHCECCLSMMPDFGLTAQIAIQILRLLRRVEDGCIVMIAELHRLIRRMLW